MKRICLSVIILLSILLLPGCGDSQGQKKPALKQPLTAETTVKCIMCGYVGNFGSFEDGGKPGMVKCPKCGRMLPAKVLARKIGD